MSTLLNPYISFPAAGGGWVPSDVSGLVLWLEADQEAYADNDPVTIATDLSGLGNDFAEATTPPTFKTNIINGLPVFRFDGSNDILTRSGSIFGATAHPYSIFAVVILQGSAGAYDPVFLSGLTGANAARLCTLISTKWGTYTGADQEAGTSLSTSTPYSLAMIAGGTGAGTFYKNSASDGTWTGSAIGSGAGFDSIGAESGFGRFAQIDLAALVAYDSELAGGDLTDAFNYLDTKYGL